jgi:bifunctional UDP-N-acetylglucosamine pyrophosphorylase/glucosamine-1-phosphate N-acetyltransferase
MKPVLIVPAAGLGTRLRSSLPKLLVPVAGRPMIDRVLALYRPFIDRAILVLNRASLGAVRKHLSDRTDVELVVQPEATGMLDAITVAGELVDAATSSWILITWCDQVAVRRRTLERLVALSAQYPSALAIMPTVRGRDPYIHFERDAGGRITSVLQRREADAMPSEGESDMGVFALSPHAFFTLLPSYSREVQAGDATGERNFLPFIPWAARRGEVVTFPSEHPLEAVGVNTPADLRLIEEYLQSRGE